jgi:hypothetical protein
MALRGTLSRTPEALAVVPARDASRRRRRGRPTLLDDRKRDLLLTAIRAGNRISAAARFAGVSPKSVNEWIRRGEGRDGRPRTEPYVSFVREVDRARAHAEVHALGTIRAAMPRSPRWAAWWLERTNPRWRLPKDRGVATLSVSPPTQPQNFILVTRATLLRLGTASERAQLGEPDVEEATQARPAEPVSESP